jgi:hypothetical protein
MFEELEFNKVYQLKQMEELGWGHIELVWKPETMLEKVESMVLYEE